MLGEWAGVTRRAHEIALSRSRIDDCPALDGLEWTSSVSEQDREGDFIRGNVDLVDEIVV
jgi:hypothetical protein